MPLCLSSAAQDSWACICPSGRSSLPPTPVQLGSGPAFLLGVREAHSMSPYFVALMIPLSCVAPLFDIPPQTWILGGCLCLSFLGIFFMQKHFLLWHSSYIVDLSEKISLSNPSSLIHLLYLSSRFCLFASWITWQYLTVVKVLELQRFQAIFDILCAKFLAKDVPKIRSSEFIISSHCFISAAVVDFWNSLWWSAFGIISHRTSFLPSRDSILDTLVCCEYPLCGQDTCYPCHCHCHCLPESTRKQFFVVGSHLKVFPPVSLLYLQTKVGEWHAWSSSLCMIQEEYFQVVLHRFGSAIGYWLIFNNSNVLVILS